MSKVPANMKIVVIGDSLTWGKPGAGYVHILERKLPGDAVINLGKGGDSTAGLLHRIKEGCLPQNIDILVLEIGTNDVFVDVSPAYPLVRTMLGQPWAKDRHAFEALYQEVLAQSHQKAKRIIAVPPLLIGEDPESKWNRELGVREKIIRELTSGYENIVCLDVRKLFIDTLKDVNPSHYIVRNPFTVLCDGLFLKDVDAVDNKAKRRGLHYTLDGVHLNSRGAHLLADAIANTIRGSTTID